MMERQSVVDFQKLLNRNKPIDLEILGKLREVGFKITPLGDDGMPVMRWSDSYENGTSLEELRKNKTRYHGVATSFGYNPEKQLYLNCLDIDSEEVFTALRDMDNPMVPDGDERSVLLMAADNTFMVKTRKDYGLHIYWLSSKENPPITQQMCRPGYEFEMKTNKAGGLTTLPPSTHRSDKNFRYFNFGQVIIAHNDKFYDIIMAELKQFLRSRVPEKPKEEKKKQYRGQRTSAEWDAAYAKLQPWELSHPDAEKLLAIIAPVYESGNRNQIMMGLAGLMYKFNVDPASAEFIMKWLLDELKDGEWQGRMWNLKSTYKRDRLHDPIGGYKMIADIDKQAAKSIMKLLLESSHLFDDEEEPKGAVEMPPV